MYDKELEDIIAHFKQESEYTHEQYKKDVEDVLFAPCSLYTWIKNKESKEVIDNV